MNNENQNQTVPPTPAPAPPASPSGESPAPAATPAVPPAPKKKNIKAVLLLIVCAALAAAGGYILLKPEAKNPASSNPPAANKTYASAKPQYFLGDSVAGYISYKADAFTPIDASKIPPIPSVDSQVNTVIVQANVTGFNDSGLYLYDIKNNKTFKLTDGGGSPRIMSDHYLLYSFDTGSGSNKRLGGKLLDLQTGQTQTVFSDTPENVPGTVCCSVSPDGLKAAFVQKNKLSVWDIRTNKTIAYTAAVNPIDPNFSRTSANDYNVETSYAAPQWLDNNTLVYTDKVAASQAQANQGKDIVDDTLYKMDTASGKNTKITTDKGGIYDIYTASGTVFFDQAAMGSTSGTTQIYVVDDSAQGSTARPLGYNPGHMLVSPDGQKVFTFDTLDGPNAYASLDANASDSSKTAASFNPKIAGVAISGVLPRGWIDGQRMILSEFYTAGTQNHEYVAIYNTATDKVEQYLKIK